MKPSVSIDCICSALSLLCPCEFDGDLGKLTRKHLGLNTAFTCALWQFSCLDGRRIGLLCRTESGTP